MSKNANKTLDRDMAGIRQDIPGNDRDIHSIDRDMAGIDRDMPAARHMLLSLKDKN
jgi:hypothetical protein